jgi:hypothetical protein
MGCGSRRRCGGSLGLEAEGGQLASRSNCGQQTIQLDYFANLLCGAHARYSSGSPSE